MTDRPIIFSAPMVRALLAGDKTQTRRLAKRQDIFWCNCRPFVRTGVHSEAEFTPAYEVGDRLWVREAHCLYGQEVFYRENEPGVTVGLGGWSSWRPSIHMPRWASRLTLTVTDVRVQRLQDISEEDAKAEGIYPTDYHYFGNLWSWDRVGSHDKQGCETVRPAGFTTARHAFINLWETINGEGGWHVNSWIVALTFTVERRNIDAHQREEVPA